MPVHLPASIEERRVRVERRALRLGMRPPAFASVEEYGRRFTDLAFWRPYIKEACRRSGIPCRTIEPTLAGTFPVFRVNGNAVVKLFSDLFDGPHDYRVELEIYSLLADYPSIPAPRLIAHGSLFPEEDTWRWPYIISTVIPGRSAGESERSDAEREGIARWLGPAVRAIHELPAGQVPSLSQPWDGFLRERRTRVTEDQRRRGSLPERLLDQIAGYLLPQEVLANRARAHFLLHADLNEDHVLGIEQEGVWRPAGIIDFGDARTGDRLYDLVALHLGLFHGDKRLLRLFLESYGWEGEEGFVSRAMSLTLLHEFDVLGPVFERFPRARQVTSLDELARLLWDVEAPGVDERHGA